MSTQRDDLRAKIFAHKPFKSELITVFGVEIEIRQPSLGQILDYQKLEDRKAAVVGMMVTYAFVPGTNERVFEDADADAILEMPFGTDMMTVNNAIERLTSVDVAGAKEGLPATSGGTTS